MDRVFASAARKAASFDAFALTDALRPGARCGGGGRGAGIGSFAAVAAILAIVGGAGRFKGFCTGGATGSERGRFVKMLGPAFFSLFQDFVPGRAAGVNCGAGAGAGVKGAEAESDTLADADADADLRSLASRISLIFCCVCLETG